MIINFIKLFLIIAFVGGGEVGGVGGLRRTSSVPDHQRQLPEKKRPDPVREVWPEMLVKIADLGNACWVVSYLRTIASVCHLALVW